MNTLVSLRAALFGIVALSPAWAATLNEFSYCQTYDNGVLVDSHEFQSLIPEGFGAACAGGAATSFAAVNFDAYANPPSLDFPPSMTFFTGGNNTLYATVPIDPSADHLLSFIVGQRGLYEFRKTFTFEKPADVSHDLFGLEPQNISSFADYGCFPADCIVYPVDIDIHYPAVLEYGVPFEVVWTVRLGLLEIRADSSLGQAEGYTGNGMSGMLVATPIPEPSTALPVLGALLLALRLARRRIH